VHKKPSLLPILACSLLLIGRLLVIREGAMMIPLLILVYLAILAISHPAPGTFDSRSLLPLTLGVIAVLCAGLAFSAPFAWRSTSGGVALSLLAAVAEEGFFRGMLFVRLDPYGRGLAILVSAASFALVHIPFYGWASLPLDLGAGVLFGWQRSDSGNWAVPGATHALANLLAVLP
jgi:membrane protease YdiL (CAAX protease family)